MRALASARRSAVQLIDTRRIDYTTRLGGPSEQVTTVFSVAEAKSHNSHATSSTQKQRKGKRKSRRGVALRVVSCTHGPVRLPAQPRASFAGPRTPSSCVRFLASGGEGSR
jgi:hypothetical protein